MFLEIKKGEDILLKFEVGLKPIPVVGDYSNLEVEIPKLEVTEEMVNQKIKSSKTTTNSSKNGIPSLKAVKSQIGRAHV